MKNILSFTSYLNESNENLEISIITPDKFEEVIDVLYSVFGFLENDRESLKNRVSPRVLNGLSICLSIDGRVEGVYLLNEKSANDFIREIREGKINDFPKEETTIYIEQEIIGRGLQGIALAVNPELKGLGLGQSLKDWVKNLNYDYIWGVADKKLENIENWKNTREILAESPNRWATIQFFT